MIPKIKYLESHQLLHRQKAVSAVSGIATVIWMTDDKIFRTGCSRKNPNDIPIARDTAWLDGVQEQRTWRSHQAHKGRDTRLGYVVSPSRIKTIRTLIGFACAPDSREWVGSRNGRDVSQTRLRAYLSF
jgi:hypothetical protein